METIQFTIADQYVLLGYVQHSTMCEIKLNPILFCCRWAVRVTHWNHHHSQRDSACVWRRQLRWWRRNRGRKPGPPQNHSDSAPGLYSLCQEVNLLDHPGKLVIELVIQFHPPHHYWGSRSKRLFLIRNFPSLPLHMLLIWVCLIIVEQDMKKCI